jgi:hypothetical protein
MLDASALRLGRNLTLKTAIQIPNAKPATVDSPQNSLEWGSKYTPYPTLNPKRVD